MSNQFEYGFEAPGPVPGLMYVTRNPMLAETMHAARPDAPMYRRPISDHDWEEVTSDADED